MDDSELFDVFSADNNPEPAQKTIQGVETHKSKSKKSKKSNKAKDRKNGENGNKDTHNGKRPHDVIVSHPDGKEETNGTEDESPKSKRSRKNQQNPIVVDSFETESDQIVPAASGLQGAPAPDHNIIIKKKVPSQNDLL
jgi:hypothetical protein